MTSIDLFTLIELISIEISAEKTGFIVADYNINRIVDRILLI